MEHFTQEDVDRMIQEAAQAAKNKKGSSSGTDAPKPAGAKPVSSAPPPQQPSVDPVEEVLASMQDQPQASAPEPAAPKAEEPAAPKTEESPAPEAPKAQETPDIPVDEPTVAEAPETPEPVTDAVPEAQAEQPEIPEQPKAETPEPLVSEPEPIENIDVDPVADQIIAEPPVSEKVEETVSEIPEPPQEEPLQKEPEAIQPEPVTANIPTEEPVQQQAQAAKPEPQQTTPAATTNIDPAFAALSSEQIYTFVMEIIKDLSEAKVELAKMQVDLEMERLKNQALSFFKKQ